jgi:hypothetical protein
MGASTVVDAHGGTIRMGIHEVARQLNAGLGPTLVAALTGTKDRKLPIRWAHADGPEPGPDFRRRLLLAHRVWTQIAPEETADVARAWFIGANPFLDEDTPLTAIREDRARPVVAAATAFVEDSSFA